MESITKFINNFSKRSGSYIMSASIISRLLSFLASWIALQLIPNKELGVVIYAFQITLFIAPIANLGLNQGLIRYGALLKNESDKNSLFIIVLKKGLIITIISATLLSIISLIIDFEIKTTSTYLQLLSITFITQFLFQIMQIQFRLQKRNKNFAKSEITYNILLVFTVFLLSYSFNELGYVLAIVLTPLITFLSSVNKLKINWNSKKYFDFIDFTFWKYGFFASLGTVTTTLLVSIDILLIEYLIPDIKMVTTYKYVSLIPYSLIFISQVVITTDFVDFTENIRNKKYIYNYIKGYMILFSFISLACVFGVMLFGEFLLSLFDTAFVKYFSTLVVLTFGITGILIFRGIFGNLLSSIGRVSDNFTITLIAIILNIILNYYLIPHYGIFGAAITSAFLMWFTGFLCMGFFFYYYKKFI